MSPSPDDRETVGPYRLVSKIATGGTAVAYIAEKPVVEGDPIQVCLKLMKSTDRDLRDWFRVEADLAKRLNHPNVVRLWDFGEHADRLFLVYELVEGPDLRAVLFRAGRLQPHVVAALGAQLASALEHAHSKDVLHRDLAPENILVDDDGRAWVGDFGMGRLSDGPTSVYPTKRREYAAPELLAVGHVTAASDVFTLGVILYECLTGRRPFDAGSGQIGAIEAGDYATIDSLVRDVPPETAEIVARALRFDPSDRPTAAQMVDNLKARELDRVSRGHLGDTAAEARRDEVARPLAEAPKIKGAKARRMSERGKAVLRGFAYGALTVVVGLVAFALLDFTTVWVRLRNEQISRILAEGHESEPAARDAGTEYVPAPGPPPDEGPVDGGMTLAATRAPRRRAARSPAMGRLRVVARPEGYIWIDSQYRGISPVELDLPAGRYVIGASLRRIGINRAEQTVTVQGGELSRVRIDASEAL